MFEFFLKEYLLNMTLREHSTYPNVGQQLDDFLSGVQTRCATSSPFCTARSSGNVVPLFSFAIMYKMYDYRMGGSVITAPPLSPQRKWTQSRINICEKGRSSMVGQGCDVLMTYYVWDSPPGDLKISEEAVYCGINVHSPPAIIVLVRVLVRRPSCSLHQMPTLCLKRSVFKKGFRHFLRTG